MADEVELIDTPAPEEVAAAPVEKEKVEEKPTEEKKPEERPRAVERDRVPLATFLEEKRKFTEALETERTERAKLAKELEALKNPPKPAPDYATDPKGFIEHATKESAREVLAKLDEAKAGIDDVKKSTTESREESARVTFLNELQTIEQAFVEKTPDYYDALGYVRQIAFNQLREMHPEASDEQIITHITQQELAMAAQAKRAGRNPVDVAYRMAVHNGYKKAEPKTEDKKKIEAPKVDDEKKLSPDLTLGASGGEAPDPTDLDPETYDPFDAAIKEMFGRKRA